MKYNKFLMALALCVGISANTSYCAAGAYDALSRSGRAVWNYGPKKVWDYGAKAWNYGAGSLVGRGLSATINIPSYIWNKVSSWSSTTQVSVLAVLLTTLAAGYRNRAACKQWFDNIFDQIWPETSKQPISMYGGTKIKKDVVKIDQRSIKQMEKQLKSKERMKAKEILKKSNYAINVIKQLQDEYKNNKNLDFVLLQHYREEAEDQLKTINIQDRLEKIKELMNIVSNQDSPQKQELLQATGLSAPSTIGEFDGLNWGENGLRYQALNEILKTMKKLQ